MQPERILGLLGKFTDGSLTAEEDIVLQELLSGLNQEARETILQEYEQVVMQTRPGLPDNVLLQRIKAEIEKIKNSEMEENEEGGKVRRMFNWRKIAVAASVILLLGIGSYFLFFNKTGKQDSMVNAELAKDVEAPKTTKAVITLADGSVVALDSVTSGTLATQGNVRVTKTTDGKIIYSGNANEVVYNTLTNPRGSKVIDMTLADGSRVWLNSGSSVTYPVAFVSNERKVSITGEAYFEIAHDASRPFKVNKGETDITVLGTHFNVNAYDDEQNIKVTLLEGSVKVSKGSINDILKPGQQAQINNDVKVVDDVDLEQVMAWKNGRFIFNGSDIESVMRQVARWYDMEVEYKGDLTKEEFVGVISQNVNISQILEMLEKTRAVSFEIIGRKIIVK